MEEPMEIDITDIPGTSRTATAMHTPRAPSGPSGPGRRRFSLGPLEETDIDSFIELLNQTWNIFGVSTLFGFVQDSEVRLKQYGKRLREEVANNLTREDVAYDATFTIIDNINRRSNSMNPPAIKVEVFAMTNATSDGIKKHIYKGIFLSWKTVEEEPNAVDSVKLPLLLCRGTRSCINVVHATISRMFDCMIITLAAIEDDLKWLIPIIITPSSKDDRSSSNEEIRMEYVIPGLPITDTIAIKFRISDLVTILNVINNNRNETMVDVTLDAEHVEKFHDVLHTQMLKLAGLQLGLCTLHKIHLPALTMMGNKMKVLNMDSMNRVLLYLNEKALEALHKIQIDI